MIRESHLSLIAIQRGSDALVIQAANHACTCPCPPPQPRVVCSFFISSGPPPPKTENTTPCLGGVSAGRGHLKGQSAEVDTSFLAISPDGKYKMWKHSKERSTPGRLLADSDIPVDIFSVDVEVAELKSPITKLTFVKLTGSGRFDTTALDASKGWIRAARLAPDCHMGNVRIQRGRRKGCVALRAVRPISAGDELQLWFSEELLAALRIPSYLNPANIQGERRYVCHECGALFEAPNPLKVHLALDCGADGSEDDLWRRLITSLSAPAETFGAVPLHMPTPSAFTPWIRAPSMLVRPPPPPPAAIPTDLSAHHARMESLVSSLGKSKKGHVCLYCGKIYSRKYGLKIHIRTHTGYKPLNCKYCLRPFGDPSNLNKHVRLHAEGETPYKCDECGKVLVRRRDLERHLKARHSGPRQTLCGTDTEDSL
ncbi:uncharacterized protein LOC132193675 [Neocloeon triangulifer]|uniref:uncharacterized protein LOC132193675 n=1 Tax=Neocloeon triangulifer TaxID=2078957 RepID=UPI00286F8AB7|nr:uncharacterized protein LOC132193675 [Neocloeon triangulifer]